MNNSTILIVDDVDINREILCEIFEDYKTIQALTAKRLLISLPPNLMRYRWYCWT